MQDLKAQVDSLQGQVDAEKRKTRAERDMLQEETAKMHTERERTGHQHSKIEEMKRNVSQLEQSLGSQVTESATLRRENAAMKLSIRTLQEQLAAQVSPRDPQPQLRPTHAHPCLHAADRRGMWLCKLLSSIA